VGESSREGPSCGFAIRVGFLCSFEQTLGLMNFIRLRGSHVKVLYIPRRDIQKSLGELCMIEVSMAKVEKD
jgi:hypothetical protein